MPAPELTLFVHWEKVLGDLLDRTQKFPKSVRFTFASRIDNHALDVLEGLVDARYASSGRKAVTLRAVDGRLAKLRVLVRLAHARRFLSDGAYEHVARQLDEAGRMVGGWRRQQASA